MSVCAGEDWGSRKWAADTCRGGLLHWLWLFTYATIKLMRSGVGVKGCAVRSAAPHPSSPRRRSPLPLNSLSSNVTCFSPSSVCCASLSLIPSLHHCLPPFICHAFRCGVKNSYQMTNIAGFCLLLLLVSLATFRPRSDSPRLNAHATTASAGGDPQT